MSPVVSLFHILISEQESHENVIHFPEDPPDALEILIMLLYGFSWFEARTEVWFKRVNKYTWPVLLLPDTYELACKYQLHDVSKQLIEELKSTLRHLTNLGPGQNGWFWTLADYIYEADHNMPDIRVELIRTLRRHANSLHGKREFVKEKLEICPGLAVELALTGGLGENGFIV